MKKIAYIIDSACFLSEDQAKKLGFYFLPLHCIADGKDFLEGKNLDDEFVRKCIEEKRNVSTSQPSPGEVMELIKSLQEEGYTHCVFSSIGSGLSKTYENFLSIANEVGIKAYGLDSANVGIAQSIPLLKVKELVENEGYNLEKAIEKAQNHIDSTRTYLMVDDLFHLSRGGRITASAAALGSMLKIKPILTLDVKQAGKIDAIEKVRTTKKALKTMANLICLNHDLSKYEVVVAHFHAQDLMEELINEILVIAPETNIKRYTLTTVIGVHTGLKSVGVQICLK